MLENFRKKDASRTTSSSMSPYARMQEALTHPSPTDTPKPETSKLETPKTEPQRIEAAQSAKPVDKAEESVSRLIVGPQIKLRGAEITDCNTLVVEGRVEAAMESRALQIAEIGEFVGKAGVDAAEIRGRFDGELTVRKQLVIRATGHVSGKIRYGKLSIEEGGELEGDIGSLGTAQATTDAHVVHGVKASMTPR